MSVMISVLQPRFPSVLPLEFSLLRLFPLDSMPTLSVFSILIGTFFEVSEVSKSFPSFQKATAFPQLSYSFHLGAFDILQPSSFVFLKVLSFLISAPQTATFLNEVFVKSFIFPFEVFIFLQSV
jgi:hypothetical protein